MSEENKTQKYYVQTIELDMLRDVTKTISMTDWLITFQMPNLAKSYVDSRDKIPQFLQDLNDYQTDENQKWRVKVERGIAYQVVDDFIMIGTKKLYDTESLLCIPNMNSFFIVPGERSIKEGGFNPAEVIQIANLVRNAPMLLVLNVTPSEEDENKFQVGASFKIIERQEKQKEENAE